MKTNAEQCRKAKNQKITENTKKNRMQKNEDQCRTVKKRKNR